MKLGEKIRCIREIQGLTQQNMATALGVTHPAYAKMEREETKLTSEKIANIAKALGVSVETLETFDKGIILNNHGNVHDFGCYKEIETYTENHEAPAALLNDSERKSYLSTIEILTKTLEAERESHQQTKIESVKDKDYLKEMIVLLNEQIRNLLSKK
jgi:transcriptional regulator with XRE-family HTH domain